MPSDRYGSGALSPSRGRSPNSSHKKRKPSAPAAQAGREGSIGQRLWRGQLEASDPRSGQLVFSPTTLTAKKDESITVTNVGSASHTFTITGKGIDVVNSPGQSQSVTIDLAPGTYEFICRFHVSLGMKGTLTVTS